MYAWQKKYAKMHFTRIVLIISRSSEERDKHFNSQIQNVCTKPLLRIHSVQHYYRNASTERTPPQSVTRNSPFPIYLRLSGRAQRVLANAIYFGEREAKRFNKIS